MMRAIIERKYKDSANGLETVTLETLDFESAALENALRGGGYSEFGYDYRQVVDVEVLPKEDSNESP